MTERKGGLTTQEFCNLNFSVRFANESCSVRNNNSRFFWYTIFKFRKENQLYWGALIHAPIQKLEGEWMWRHSIFPDWKRIHLWYNWEAWLQYVKINLSKFFIFLVWVPTPVKIGQDRHQVAAMENIQVCTDIWIFTAWPLLMLPTAASVILTCVSWPNTSRLLYRHTQKQMPEGFSRDILGTITSPNQLLDICPYLWYLSKISLIPVLIIEM